MNLQSSKLSRLKPVEAEKLIKALSKIGFKSVRQRGSHLVVNYPTPKGVRLAPEDCQDYA